MKKMIYDIIKETPNLTFREIIKKLGLDEFSEEYPKVINDFKILKNYHLIEENTREFDASLWVINKNCVCDLLVDYVSYIRQESVKAKNIENTLKHLVNGDIDKIT